MLVQRGGRILFILGVCYFLAARFCLCYLIFLLYLDRTVHDYPAVENHGGGACDCDAVVIVMP